VIGREYTPGRHRRPCFCARLWERMPQTCKSRGLKKPKDFKDSTLGLFNRLTFDLVLLAGNVPVLAAKKKQRFPALNFRVLDFANDNRVISGDMRCNDAAT